MKTLYHLAVLCSLFFCQDILCKEKPSYLPKEMDEKGNEIPYHGIIQVENDKIDLEATLFYNGFTDKLTGYLIRHNSKNSISIIPMTLLTAQIMFPQYQIQEENYEENAYWWMKNFNQL